MENIDNDILIKLVTAFAVIISAFIAGMLGFFAQWKIKQFESEIVQRKEKESEKIKFYIPLLRTLYLIDDRFNRIIQNLETNWLDAKHLEDIKQKQGFAQDPTKIGYFIISSIYLIACFFGLVEAMKKGVDTTKLTFNIGRVRLLWNKTKKWVLTTLGSSQKQSIFQFDPEITKVCRLFQYEELFETYVASKELKNPTDACKLHKHIQHSIGEMMLKKKVLKDFRVISFRQFYESYVSDEKFRFWFVLLEKLFTDLSNFEKNQTIEKQVEIKNDIRPLRLIAIQYWCRILMKNISKELDLAKQNFETRPPAKVLKSLSTNLQETIKSYEIVVKDPFNLTL